MEEFTKLCIGRAFAFAFAPIAAQIKPNGERHNDIRTWEVPGEDEDNELKVQYIQVDKNRALHNILIKYMGSDVNDLVVMELGGELGISAHYVLMFMYKIDKTVYMWYRNPWGFEPESDEIEYDTLHPMEYLKTIPEYNNDSVFILDHRKTMPPRGPQAVSEECSRSDNCVENILSACNMGACVSWSELYTFHVMKWLTSLKKERSPALSRRAFTDKLLGIEASQSSKTKSLELISKFAYDHYNDDKKWSMIPMKLFRAIFNASPDKVSPGILEKVTLAYDSFMKKQSYLYKGEIDYENMETFLIAAGLHSEGVRKALQDDRSPLIDLSNYINFEEVNESSMGTVVVTSTMLLVACKIRESVDILSNILESKPRSKRGLTGGGSANDATPDSDDDILEVYSKRKLSDDDILEVYSKRPRSRRGGGGSSTVY